MAHGWDNRSDWILGNVDAGSGFQPATFNLVSEKRVLPSSIYLACSDALILCHECLISGGHDRQEGDWSLRYCKYCWKPICAGCDERDGNFLRTLGCVDCASPIS